MESVLLEARKLIGEADWTMFARRHVSDAQALHPGDPRILDPSFALEAKLLGGRPPGTATTRPWSAMTATVCPVARRMAGSPRPLGTVRSG